MRWRQLDHRVVLGLLALPLLLAGCGSPQSLHTKANDTPVVGVGPVRTGGPLSVATGDAAALPPPVPSGGPTSTLPPAGPPPGAGAFTARLIFTPTLTAADFTGLVRGSGVVPLQIGLHNPRMYGAGEMLAGQGIDSGTLLQMLNDPQRHDMTVSWAEVRLDHGQYARLEADPRILTDPTASTPLDAVHVLARWRVAAENVHTVRGHQTLEAFHDDGTPAPLPPIARGAATTDEVVEWGRDGVARFRFVMHTAQGDMLTLSDGAHASRYSSWLHEVYRPLPDSATLEWDDSLDVHPLSTYLPPAPVGYALLGSRTLDGRGVIELQADSYPVYPQTGVAAHVFLDAATYLPYRITVQASAPAAPHPVILQRTFTPLDVNGPVAAADFQGSFPSGTVTVYEPSRSKPRIETYPDLQAAAKQAGFPLYAPPGLDPAPVYSAYRVEIDGRQNPVIALANGTIMEGRYLPSRLSVGPLLDFLADATPVAFDLDGEPAVLRGGALILTRGETHIWISAVPTQDQARQVARRLQPVP